MQVALSALSKSARKTCKSSVLAQATATSQPGLRKISLSRKTMDLGSSRPMFRSMAAMTGYVLLILVKRGRMACNASGWGVWAEKQTELHISSFCFCLKKKRLTLFLPTVTNPPAPDSTRITQAAFRPPRCKSTRRTSRTLPPITRLI